MDQVLSFHINEHSFHIFCHSSLSTFIFFLSDTFLDFVHFEIAFLSIFTITNLSTLKALRFL